METHTNKGPKWVSVDKMWEVFHRFGLIYPQPLSGAVFDLLDDF